MRKKDILTPKQMDILRVMLMDEFWTFNYSKASKELNIPTSTIFDTVKKKLRPKIKVVVNSQSVDNFIKQYVAWLDENGKQG